MTKIPPRMIAAMVVMLCALPARADPWILCRHGDGIRLLAPSPIHVQLPRYYRWEGTASTFEAEYVGADLCLTIHRDAYMTPWWYDCRIVQTASGEVWVTWDSTREGCDVTFARYPSFRAAWRDKRVRKAVQPALCGLRQWLPEEGDAWELMRLGW